MTNDELAADAARRVAAQMFDYAGRKATILKAIEDALTAAKFAPLGDNHHNAAACPYCSPKLTSPPAPSEVAELRAFREGWRAERALIHAELNKAGALNCDNIMLRIEDLACRAEKAEAEVERMKVELADAKRALAFAGCRKRTKRDASPPAPSGWQQRIARLRAALELAKPTHYAAECLVCDDGDRPCPTLAFIARIDALLVESEGWQHAKDAHPPAGPTPNGLYCV